MAMNLQAPPAAQVEADVARALAEDIGSGDVTASLLPDTADIAYLLCKEPAVVCGRPWFDACHRALDPDVRIEWRVAEGDRVEAGTVLATLAGRSRALVTAERTALNFLQTLTGTATTTASHVDAVRGTGARILDTRKTIPGLRLAQKYAVRVGGDQRAAAPGQRRQHGAGLDAVALGYAPFDPHIGVQRAVAGIEPGPAAYDGRFLAQQVGDVVAVGQQR